MKNIYLKGVYKVDLNNNGRMFLSDEAKHQTQIIDSINISIVCEETTTFIATKTIEIEDDQFNYFTNQDIVDISLDEHTRSLPITIRKILEYLRFFFHITDIDEKLILSGETLWSLDNSSWERIPARNISYSYKWGSWSYRLSDNFLQTISELTQQNIRPFFACNYLCRAITEENTRHKWINATIAAELAFKEFLSILDQRITTLILNMPSPPIKTLYKVVLKDYTGEESPVWRKLQEGAEKRNKLIHQPNSVSPTEQEATIYIQQVEIAILHLYKLLYKENEFIQYLYENALSNK